ncbi:MAG TPA: YciI family protein [Longimicrobiales bacterium]
MRVMVIVKATEETEGSQLPSRDMLQQMGRYNEELVKAGILLAADGLHPSSRGKRIEISGTQRKVVDGPFAETKELVAGFWIWQVKSLEEAVEWARRCPNPTGDVGVLEIRPVHEPEDLIAAIALEQQEEKRNAEQAARNARS